MTRLGELLVLAGVGVGDGVGDGIGDGVGDGDGVAADAVT